MSGFAPRFQRLFRRASAFCIGLGAVGLLWASSGACHGEETAISFYRDVMPVFSKAGCNAGACHGNASGKGGLKLSLRGENPSADLQTLTKDLRSRRVNIDRPDESLLLRKPTKQSDHEGGLRFPPESPEAAILRRWLAQGAKGDLTAAPALVALDISPTEAFLDAPQWSAAISVTARFADGSARDVTRWAVYESSHPAAKVSAEGKVTAPYPLETDVAVRFLHLQAPVRLAFVADRPQFQWANPEPFNEIDPPIFAKLQRLKINPSAVCDDQAFLRRAYFDLLGIPPTAAHARAFLTSQQPQREKRAQLVDDLLNRPEFGEHWALKWGDLLRNEEKVIDRRGVAIFWEWLRDKFNADAPLDATVREMLTGFGSTYLQPEANFYRALRDPAARAESAAQIFLGTRLQCAKCHNHPFEKWTQNDYYRFAGLFDGIDYHIPTNRRGDNLDKHEFVGEQAVFLSEKREFKDPRSGKPPPPGLLDPSAPPLDAASDRFLQLAAWLTSPQHPLFAKVQANRLWRQLMGRGIVDPVDDFRATNPPSNPQLLELLAGELSRNGFRIKPLLRKIMLSRAYQVSSEPNETNRDDSANFSRAAIRRLTAEQLADAIDLSLGVRSKFRQHPDGLRAGQIPGANARNKGEKPTDDDQFLRCFGKPVRLLCSETERCGETSLAQVFTLTSGPGLHAKLIATDNALGRILEHSAGDFPQAVGELFWSTLSRAPTDAEREHFSKQLSESPDKRQTMEDMAWSLINAKEFWLRR